MSGPDDVTPDIDVGAAYDCWRAALGGTAQASDLVSS